MIGKREINFGFVPLVVASFMAGVLLNGTIQLRKIANNIEAQTQSCIVLEKPE